MSTADERAAQFFVPLENTRPFLKAAFQGFAGSGKTYTMALIAAGLHEFIGSKKPIVIFDTERSAKFLRPFFISRGIQVLHKESRSLADLSQAMTLCDAGVSDILLCDSITHVWEGFLESYKRDVVKRQQLRFDDWGRIKPMWKERFADVFVQGRFHGLITGRAGYEYSQETDEESGKKEIVKTGIKMRVEGETAYEPDILVMMERHEELTDKNKANQVWREATVLKDRSTLIDGKTFRNPTFEQFKPVLEFLLLDAKPGTVQRDGNDAALFTREDSGERQRTDRAILLEEIQAELMTQWPSQSADDKAARINAMKEHFASNSWTFIEKRAAMPSLIDGLRALRGKVVGDATTDGPGSPGAGSGEQSRPGTPAPSEPGAITVNGGDRGKTPAVASTLAPETPENALRRASVRKRFFALLSDLIHSGNPEFGKELLGTGVVASGLRHQVIERLIGEPVGKAVSIEQYEKCAVRMDEILTGEPFAERSPA